MGYPFFSPEWGEQIVKTTNDNEAIYRGFRDPKSFTNKMEWRTKDGSTLQQEWEEGRLIYFGPPKFDESEIWIVLEADTEAWRSAAEGEVDGARLLMGGKMKMPKGPMSAAIENAGAFNEFFRNWGNVDTDWPG